jgi:hypothetical protein
MRNDFPLIPDMVAGGDDMRSKIEEFPGDIHGQSETGGSVFPIDHDEVDRMHIHEAVKPPGKGQPAGAANDISDEKNFQRIDSVTRGERKKVALDLVFVYFAYSTARVSRMTLTLIWPG